MSLAIDLLIAFGVLWMALQTILGRSVFRSILMFIVFGLIMALAWARLHAPDLALAEAAIGAGITGALLLVTWRRLQTLDHRVREVGSTTRPLLLTVPIAIGSALLIAAIAWAALTLPARPVAAGLEAWERLDEVGVGNPVTAVLLGFRAYDTLMEMAVLLAAWLGARAVSAGISPADLPSPVDAEVPLVGALLGVVVPISVVVAVYLLQAGSNAPGGAFQGGAVLAAGGVLLCLTGRLVPAPATSLPERVGLVFGLASFSLIGLAMLAVGAPMLALPGVWAIYLVETALLLSIALTLVLLFVAAPGLRRAPWT